MLREILPLVGTQTADRIEILLEKSCLNQESLSENASPPFTMAQNNVFAPHEPMASSLIRFPVTKAPVGDVSFTNQPQNAESHEDFPDIVWLRRVQREADQQKSHQPKSSNPAFHAFDYQNEDFGSAFHGSVQMYLIPTRPVADQYLKDYLDMVHPNFPVLNWPLFCAQYGSFFDNGSLPSDEWLAILNMIFAIGAKYDQMTAELGRGDVKDHQVYLSRARKLSMRGDTLFNPPNLQQVQLEGLVSFYLLCSDQIGLAWRISALAIRSAISLGVNLKNDSKNMTQIDKEIRNRLWWGLYTLEHMLGIIIGRPGCIKDAACASPLPLPFDENQLPGPSAVPLLDDPKLRNMCIDAVMSSPQDLNTCLELIGKTNRRSDYRNKPWLHTLPITSGLCFLYHCDLAVLTEDIMKRLYLGDQPLDLWAHIESQILELRAKVDLWHISLPTTLRYEPTEKDDQLHFHQKMRLALQYHSARVMLGRPWLHPGELRLDGISMQKLAVSHRLGADALKSALRVLELILEKPDVTFLYKICQWWRVLHYIVQATATVLRELAFGSIQMPGTGEYMLRSTIRAVRWLQSMAERSTASHRAWQVCDNTLRRLSSEKGYDISRL
ncbi:Transcription factor [Penicillium brevicompactum]|uniref:Transcription factor n=1 Tax=Penicillium brevicompactum TaxID=5074 RepID=UPI00253FD805|nr:Transcription factor [Penicillium brevicompactum]KAJ5337404.1 Transcription factor [Penicillium brevicompactum]